MIQRLLIANRGEIAVRIARAATEAGIVPLGIYSEADENAYHVQFMDESACVGPAPAAQSYLNIETVVEMAKAMNADAVHPGYGFLSERAAFAQAVLDAGMIFVGPTPAAMASMGSKIEAKRLVRERGVPVVPGYDGDDQSLARLRKEAEHAGFPLLIKASAGGGGRGMRVVESLDSFDESLEAAKREALAAFGSDAVLLERYLRDPRHIEFQILADTHGTTLHIGERECSIQRRHQKIVEEAPSVALTPELRARMGAAAVAAAESVGYVGAGTVEFMLDRDGAFYFLEMNTRLQVEHPVTEQVYGIDLVRWQLRVADGERLDFTQADVQPRGWAIEVRIYAEDPYNHMLPSTGTISRWDAPQGPGVRLDSGVDVGSDVGVYYDPMLAKLIASGADRAQAIARLREAIADFTVAGVRTNLPLLAWIARDDAFIAGDTTTSFLAQRLDDSVFARPVVTPEAVRTAAGAILASGNAPWRIGNVGVPIRLQSEDGTIYAVVASSLGGSRWMLQGAATGVVDTDDLADASPVVLTLAPPPSLDAAAGATSGGSSGGTIKAPMPGKIVKIAAVAGETVADRALLIVLEAMKMEHRIEAAGAGRVKSVLVREGDIVSGGTALVELEAP